MLYDPAHKVLCIQWVDKKVVHFMSTLNILGLVDVQRRKGAEVILLFVDKTLRVYQKLMDAVDRDDQYR